ncbi:hypothetical protein NL676_013486 [Syzygium grande]|nr:hypothetical protein NL676_013486 [Syzygium grande]
MHVLLCFQDMGSYVELFGTGLGDLYYPSNDMDPYLKDKDDDDDSEELEDLSIKPMDSLIVSWLDCPLKGGDKGNFVAVGSMEPAIEIWDLDVKKKKRENRQLRRWPKAFAGGRRHSRWEGAAALARAFLRPATLAPARASRQRCAAPNLGRGLPAAVAAATGENLATATAAHQRQHPLNPQLERHLAIEVSLTPDVVTRPATVRAPEVNTRGEVSLPPAHASPSAHGISLSPVLNAPETTKAGVSGTAPPCPDRCPATIPVQQRRDSSPALRSAAAGVSRTAPVLPLDVNTGKGTTLHSALDSSRTLDHLSHAQNCPQTSLPSSLNPAQVFEPHNPELIVLNVPNSETVRCSEPDPLGHHDQCYSGPQGRLLQHIEDFVDNSSTSSETSSGAHVEGESSVLEEQILGEHAVISPPTTRFFFQFSMLNDIPDRYANVQTGIYLPITSADRQVKIWDVAAGKCNITMEHHTDKVQAVAWNHHAPQVLLSGSFDHSVVMKDGRIPSHSGYRWSVMADVESLAWDPHSEHSFVVCPLKTAPLEDSIYVLLHLILPPESRPSFTLHAHEKAASTISYNRLAPNLLTTGSTDKMVKLWDLTNNQPSCIGAVFSVSFSEDSPFSLAIGGSKGRLEVWDALSDAAVSRRFGNHS